MSDQPLIIIVEDEPKIAQILVDFLSMDGFQTLVLHDGKDAVETIQNKAPSAVILDLMLPHKSGLVICEELRQFSDVPILMLTARVDEIDRLMGLNIGADDYVCKPFSVREVVARIKVILRRQNTNNHSQGRILQYKKVCLDLEKHTCTLAGEIIELTPVEFRLLTAFINKPGAVFTRATLMSSCYEDDRIVSARTIDSHMKNLRAKLTDADNGESIFQSVYGVGYKIG
ncbi:response regulator [Gilvimarinus polysaccharolyticus]|uniref:response regulator n=1 Tax=Gilvimarinus polysaccharolyticus TaxID=863921 RepID=UPI000673BAAC|nr:response regulator [Gilvimarinus polysaccharolyticus]